MTTQRTTRRVQVYLDGDFEAIVAVVAVLRFCYPQMSQPGMDSQGRLQFELDSELPPGPVAFGELIPGSGQASVELHGSWNEALSDVLVLLRTYFRIVADEPSAANGRSQRRIVAELPRTQSSEA